MGEDFIGAASAVLKPAGAVSGAGVGPWVDVEAEEADLVIETTSNPLQFTVTLETDLGISGGVQQVYPVLESDLIVGTGTTRLRIAPNGDADDPTLGAVPGGRRVRATWNVVGTCNFSVALEETRGDLAPV